MLARDVLTGRHGRVPLLTSGTRLQPELMSALERAGVRAVYVDDELGSGIDVPLALSEETRTTAAAALERACARAQQSASDPEVHASSIGELGEVARLIAEEIAACGDAVLALQDLATADAYTVQHSIDVTALGLLVGRQHMLQEGWLDFRGQRRFDRVDERLVTLGLGLILHDIGKLIVPAQVLSKPGKLTAEEWELVREHPLAGLDLLASAPISPLALTVIRSHHERWNGSGYPDRSSGSTIHQFARLAAVADVYDAVTSERPYSTAWTSRAGWQLIVDGAGTSFDPGVVSAFRRVVAPYPPGAEITLEDGRRGAVTRVDPHELERPHVRIGWEADGTPVEPYELQLDGLPAASRAA
jgi:HD-GYP domain-containing protein (c-di-GMP phosphodiesterase class II)